MKFTVNGKEYESKAFNLNTVCDLEDIGISLEDVNKKRVSMIRGYFAICSGLSVDEAGKEIEAHMVAGNNLDNISEVMNNELEKSDFFRALTEDKETKKAESKKEQD